MDPAGGNPGTPQCWNRYAYALNNPTKYVDPDGKWVETAFDVAMAGISIRQARKEPGFWNITGAVLDVAAVIVPVVPAVGGRAIDAVQATNKLADDVARTLNQATDARGATLRARLADPPPGMVKPQAHHDLPQAFKKDFDKAGVNINDPSFGRWVEGGSIGDHQKWSKEFNDQWREFFRTNRDPSREQILDRMSELRSDPRFQ
jgi:hypothetical protein